MNELLDVSKWQDPSKFDWAALKKRGVTGMIARASYGKNTADSRFVAFAERIRAEGLVFGAYHFYRQTHSVEEQMATFNRQLDAIGGLQPGDFFPVLDMEHNGANGDGAPKAKLWNRACDEIGDAWKAEYGGCILYYSSFFPEWLGAKAGWDRGDPIDDWTWMLEPGYRHWLADYSCDPGSPRGPYSPRWHIHQPKPRKVPEYHSGKAEVDYDVMNPDATLGELRIDRVGQDVSDDACKCDNGARPGGAFPSDFDQGVELTREGAEKTLEGLRSISLLQDKSQ